MPAEEIRRILIAKADAIVRRSAADLSGLIHDDFVYLNASGRRFDKATYVATFCVSGEIVFSEQRIGDLQVTPFSGFAVATMILRDRFVVRGRDVSATYRSLAVFTKVGDRWLWAAGQTVNAAEKVE